MADKAVAVSVKPKLRGLLHAQIKRNLTTAIVLAVLGGITWKFTISEPRKARYAEFYRNFDAEKDFEEKRSKGLFQSC